MNFQFLCWKILYFQFSKYTVLINKNKLIIHHEILEYKVFYKNNKKSNSFSNELKRQIKELKCELKFKEDELIKIKKNIKSTSIYELEVQSLNLYNN